MKTLNSFVKDILMLLLPVGYFALYLLECSEQKCLDPFEVDILLGISYLSNT